jgi:hypothetical protein
VTIDHSLIANNEAEESGAGLFMGSLSSQATIVNSTISGNVARVGGGGVFANRTVVIRNSTT